MSCCTLWQTFNMTISEVFGVLTLKSPLETFTHNSWLHYIPLQKSTELNAQASGKTDFTYQITTMYHNVQGQTIVAYIKSRNSRTAHQAMRGNNLLAWRSNQSTAGTFTAQYWRFYCLVSATTSIRELP